MTLTVPGGFLFDYGGTLVEEISFDVRAGNEWLLARASYRPPNLGIDDVLTRARRITSEVADRREETHVETPWPAMTRLIHDFLGVRFDLPWSELEIGFWKASAVTKPMPGVRLALERFRELGIPLGVVSNTCFSESVIRYELGKHGLAEYLDVVVVSSEYAVRKPNPVLFDTGAARLGKLASSIWFVGDRLDMDIAGAKAAGMTAAWFNRSNTEDPARTADYVFADWNELMLHTSRLAGLASGGDAKSTIER
jgi:putative hydrolase of the HAD superfamily